MEWLWVLFSALLLVDLLNTVGSLDSPHSLHLNWLDTAARNLFPGRVLCWQSFLDFIAVLVLRWDLILQKTLGEEIEMNLNELSEII